MSVPAENVDNPLKSSLAKQSHDDDDDPFSSTEAHLLAVPSTRTKTYGDRAFAAAAPKLWNKLPDGLRAFTEINAFKSELKTFLFKNAYNL